MPRGATDLPPEPDRADLTDWLEWRRLYSGDHIGAIIEIGKQLEEVRRFLIQTRAELHELRLHLTDDGR